MLLDKEGYLLLLVLSITYAESHKLGLYAERRGAQMATM
jgi:hypothetical protein